MFDDRCFHFIAMSASNDTLCHEGKLTEMCGVEARMCKKI